jgi:uncharacterized caspase-like protein
MHSRIALRQVGFQTVELATDLDRNGMVKALQAFHAQADGADWALVYFAGHGIEINRANYLIPIDAKILDDRDVTIQAVSYEDLLNAIDGAALRIVVLDVSGTSHGLAPPPEPKVGTVVAYAVKDGQVAANDAGGSPFARAFIAEMKVPGVDARRMFDRVRADVLNATGNRQQPFTYGTLSGRKDFFFVAEK